MEIRENPAPEDVTLSALIDDELPEADAERMRARLTRDLRLARRYAELIEATSEFHASYDDAIEVIGVVAELHARAIRQLCTRASAIAGAPSGKLGDGRASGPMREVDRAVAGLTSQQRSVLSLAVFEDLSYSEIAETLGVRPRQVMQWLAEARSALRARLLWRAPAAGDAARLAGL